MTNLTEKNELKRRLGFWDSAAINIGIVIGVGIFRTPSEISNFLPSSFWILFAWLLGGAISLCGVLTYAELSSRFPHTGGTYIYLREAYGKQAAFLFGWMEFLILRAGSLAAVAYVLAAYLRQGLGLSEDADRWVAVTALLFFTGLNFFGLRYGKGVQNVFSSLKVLTLLAMSAAIFIFWDRSSAPESVAAPFHAFPSPLALGPAMIAILFSYGGWHESTFMAGEFQDSPKKLALSLITSSFIVTFLYLLANAAYLWAMTPAQIAGSDAVAADIFNRLFGSTGNRIMTLAIITSAAGALNSTILTGARIPFALAQDTPRFSWFGAVHSKYETPHLSYLLNGIWACVLALWGDFERLIFFCGFPKWFFFTLAAASIFIIRAKRSRDTNLHSLGSQGIKVSVPRSPGIFTLGWPYAPIFFVIASIGLTLSVVMHARYEALVGAALVLAGIPVYDWAHKQK